MRVHAAASVWMPLHVDRRPSAPYKHLHPLPAPSPTIHLRPTVPTTHSLAFPEVRPQFKIALVAILRFSLIVKKLDHHKFLIYLTAIFSLTCWPSFVKITYLQVDDLRCTVFYTELYCNICGGQRGGRTGPHCEGKVFCMCTIIFIWFICVYMSRWLYSQCHGHCQTFSFQIKHQDHMAEQIKCGPSRSANDTCVRARALVGI